jgi:ElaB/YqjD/DUF883 family membrane-anchored ribosome-binding protein
MIDRIKDAGIDLNDQTEQMKEKALEVASAARERFAQGGQWVREFTIHKPAQALGVALGMGVILGWLIKRR